MTPSLYADQLRALLPRGRALDDGGIGALTDLLDALAQEYARVDARGDALLLEAMPSSTFELLPDWERVCGLPDSCTPDGQTIDQRRQALIVRLQGNGTPSIPYLTGLAADLGYEVTIVKRHARRYRDALGAYYGGTDWQFVWEVHAPLHSVTYRLSGDVSGEPYATWQNAVLECVMRQHAPAHSIVIFVYN